MKRFISLMLAVALSVSVLAFPAFAETTKNNTVIINGASITIGSNYGADEKLWLQFGPCGPNSLTQLNTISKNAANSATPSNTWLSSGTDWVGPVHMKARDAADETGGYAGGWHKREGDGTPSARSESVVFKVDGEVQTGNVTLDGSVVEIIVTNELYTGLTAETGASGLREVVHYTISGNVIDVENTLTALNDVTITQYFGLQSVSRTYTEDMIKFTNGQENSYVGGYYTHVSGTKAAYPNVNAVVHSNEDGDRLVMTLDRTVGLGKLDYLLDTSHVATHSQYNKAYFNLVGGIPCEVDKGEFVQWKGQYLFDKMPASETVIADYDALTRASLMAEASTDATVTGNLTLPTSGNNGSTILWETSNREVISETGVVRTPELTTNVQLTATIFDGAGASMEKIFAFRVPGKEGPVDSSGTTVMPEKGALIRSDNFDDNSLDATTITGIVGNVKEENGVLHFKRMDAADGDVVQATVHLKADKTPIYGTTFLEFTVTKNSTYTGITAYVNGNTGKFCQISIGANKNLTIYYGDGHKALTPAEVGTDTLNFKIVVDSGKGTFRLWLNDRFICAEKGLSTPGGLTSLYFLQSKATGLTTDVNLDNLSVHTAKTAGVITMEKTSNITSLIYVNDANTAMTGKFGVEVAVKRTSCTHALDVYFSSSEGNVIYSRLLNGVVYGYWADVKGSGTKEGHTVPGVSNTDLLIYMEFDTRSEEVSVWYNGVYAGSGYGIAPQDLLSISTYAFDGSCDPVITYARCTDLTDDHATSIIQYQDSFDGATVSGQVELSNMTQTDGSLSVPDRTKSSGAVVYLKEDKSDVTGNFTVEFTTSRSFVNATTDLRFCDAAGNTYTNLRWWSNADCTYTSVENRATADAGSTGGSYKLHSEVGSQTSMHVKATFNTKDHTFSVWINGHEIVKDVFSSVVCDGVASLSLSNSFAATGSGNTGYGDAKLQDILYYSPMPGLGLSEFLMDYNAYDKKVSVASPVDGSACVLVASYQGDMLVSAVSKTITLKAHDDILADTSELDVLGADRVVLYLWDGESTLKPICEAQKVSGAIAAN